VEVLAEGRKGFIISTTGLDTLLVRDKETGQARSVALKDIEPCFASRVEVSPLEGVSDAKLQVAQTRLEHILPLIEIPERTRKMVEARALEVGVHTNTLYHWIKLYEESRLLTALVPQGRNDKGATRLSPEVEAVITDVLEKQYLQKQRKSVGTVYRDIKARCTADGVLPPHINTVRDRVANLSGSLRSPGVVGARRQKRSIPRLKGISLGRNGRLLLWRWTTPSWTSFWSTNASAALSGGRGSRWL